MGSMFDTNYTELDTLPDTDHDTKTISDIDVNTNTDVNLEQELTTYLKSINETYDKPINKSSLRKIHCLLLHDIMFKPVTSEEYLFIGVYHGIRRCFRNMKINYKVAINIDNNSDALCNMGYYYEEEKHNYYKAINYYKLASEQNNLCAMTNLAMLYEKYGEYDKMKTYYLMAIEKDYKRAMRHLADYYAYDEKNHELAETYYLMAINKGSKSALCELNKYYKSMGLIIDQIELCISYCNDYVMRNKIVKYINNYAMSTTDDIESCSSNIERFINLITTFEFTDDEINRLCLAVRILIKSINTKISKIKLHFDYSMSGKGYTEAKDDFIKLCS